MFHPNGPSFIELCDQALSSTRVGYDKLAPKFDVTPFRTPEDMLRRIVPVIRERQTSNILDLCCGTGAVFEYLDHGPIQRVGLDFSAGMLRQAQRNRAPDSSPTLLVQAEALRLPFRRNFDVVTCFGALGHFRARDHEPLFRGVHEVLVPGGRVLFPSFKMPGAVTPARWLLHGFNMAMHLRNAVFPEEFVMFYLGFCLDRVRSLLPTLGFRVDVREGIFEEPYDRMLLVCAEKRASRN